MFAGDKLGEVLIVELRGQNGKYPRREIEVPLLAEIEPVEEQGGPPEISEVRVLQVKRGVFLTVTVSWRTDTLTDAQVRYGEKELALTSDRSMRLGRFHVVELHDLKPDKTYTFRVISTDIFGRSRTSEPFSFSTAKPMAKDDTRDMSDAGDKKEVGINSRFRRHGNDYLVELTMTRPVSVFVGSRGDVRKQEAQEEEFPTKGPEEPEKSHAGLSEGTLLNIAACRNCHRNQGIATHPVNVLPKPGMTIPPEYQTLPDGRITCATCHSTHGSDYEYLAVRPGRRELCVGCHKDML